MMSVIRHGILALAVAVGMAAAIPAWAASAVTYGQRTSHYATAPTVSEAVANAFERCSRADSHCLLLTSCEAQGYGATAVSHGGGLIAGVGATCGMTDSEQAKAKAAEHCGASAPQTCEIRGHWLDR